MLGWTTVCTRGLVTLAGLGFVATSVLAQPFELVVKKDQLIGSSEGTLVFAPDGVVYETDDTSDARHWTYEDVKQVQVLSPTRIVIKTFEDQGWTRLGADRSFDFEVTEGSASREFVAFLLGRIEQPMVSAVLPVVTAAPDFQVSVKLRQRLEGSHGSLTLVGDRLIYDTDQADHARVWRPVDVSMVFQPDRHRLNIEAYEGGSDRTRTFSFDLKEPLPTGFLDAVWARVYTPSMPRIGDRQASR